MGYTTDFDGQFEFNKPLTKDMLGVYKKFHDERHEDGYELNGKPSIWLQWEIVEHNNKFYLQWDECEKFYKYVEWLEYLIKYMFKVWGVKLNGKVRWIGEDSFNDQGTIIIKDSVVKVNSSRWN